MAFSEQLTKAQWDWFTRGTLGPYPYIHDSWKKTMTHDIKHTYRLTADDWQQMLWDWLLVNKLPVPPSHVDLHIDFAADTAVFYETGKTS